jgi:beta-alanine degradation protein BauB
MDDLKNGSSSDPDDNERRRALVAVLATLGVSRGVLAQDAAAVQPRAYRVAFENDKLRVLEFNSRPGMGVCGIGMHSHPAHLTVVMSDTKARVKLPDGKSFIGDKKFGDVFWSEAETHDVENITGKNTRALLVELKGSVGGKS